MTLMEKTIEIEASADKIWPLVSWDRIPEWFDMFKSAQWTSQQKNKVGSRVHVVSELADTKNDLDVEITEFADGGEGTRAWKTVGGSMAAAGAFYLKPEGNKTLLMMVSEYKLPYGPIGTMLDKIRVRKAFENSFVNSCMHLKEISETA